MLIVIIVCIIIDIAMPKDGVMYCCNYVVSVFIILCYVIVLHLYVAICCILLWKNGYAKCVEFKFKKTINHYKID